MSNTRGRASAESFAENARKLRELQQDTTPVRSAEALTEVIRLRQELAAAQQLERDGAEGEAIGKALFDRMNKMG